MRFSLLIVTFFLFRFHFLPQGRKFPPLSHYIVEKFFFLPRNCWVGGTNSHSPFRRCSEFFFEAPHPTPVCRVFCLALQAYQVRSGAFVSGIFLFPSRRVSSSRCPRTDAWKMSWLCLTELYSSLVPMPFRLLQFVPWAQCFLKPPPIRFPPSSPPLWVPLNFWGEALGTVPPLHVSLVQSVQTTAVTTGNYRPCICDTLTFFSLVCFEETKRFFFVVSFPFAVMLL